MSDLIEEADKKRPRVTAGEADQLHHENLVQVSSYQVREQGEASSPGSPKWLRRTPSARDGRGGATFHEQVRDFVGFSGSRTNHGPGSDPPTVPASSGAVRSVFGAPGGWTPRMVLTSRDLPATTVRDTKSEGAMTR